MCVLKIFYFKCKPPHTKRSSSSSSNELIPREFNATCASVLELQIFTYFSHEYNNLPVIIRRWTAVSMCWPCHIKSYNDQLGIKLFQKILKKKILMHSQRVSNILSTTPDNSRLSFAFANNLFNSQTSFNHIRRHLLLLFSSSFTMQQKSLRFIPKKSPALKTQHYATTEKEKKWKRREKIADENSSNDILALVDAI